jgi:hypothetical protein
MFKIKFALVMFLLFDVVFVFAQSPTNQINTMKALGMVNITKLKAIPDYKVNGKIVTNLNGERIGKIEEDVITYGDVMCPTTGVYIAEKSSTDNTLSMIIFTTRYIFLICDAAKDIGNEFRFEIYVLDPLDTKYGAILFIK